MGALQPVESAFDKLNNKLPALPKNVKNSIAQFAAWASLAGAALLAYVAFKRWDNIQDINDAQSQLDAIRESAGAFGSYLSGSVDSQLGSSSTKMWILFIFAALGTGLLIAAFFKLQKLAKQGWDFALWGALASLAYVIAFLIISEFEFGDIFLHLLVTLAGLYVVLQIKDYFTGKEKIVAAPKVPTPPTQTPPQA